jgi:hypothetical protein
MSSHWLPPSWQLAQFVVMPPWIWAVLGAGVANKVPGTVLVATAGICAAGIDPRWQASQAVAEGMCALGPTGELGGITTMLVTPMKDALVMVGPWQLTQVVIPAWLIAEFVNRAPLGTGVVATLEAAPTWQDSQAAVVGMWLEGVVTIEKFAAGMAKPAATVGPWHCAQLLVVLGALLWMSMSAGITEKSAPLWQFEQLAVAEVGMWFAGFS